jgi:hypothetical protein
MEKLLTFMNYWLGKIYIQNIYVPKDKQASQQAVG